MGYLKPIEGATNNSYPVKFDINDSLYYKSFWVSKFINKFMKHGRKATVSRQVLLGFQDVKIRLGINPTIILIKSLSVLRPTLGVAKFYTKRQSRRKRRKKGFLIPVPISEVRQMVIALSWFVKTVHYQKRFRHAKRYKNYIRGHKKHHKRGLSWSRKKTYLDRFHISLRGQELHSLITTKFIDIYKNDFTNLARYKLLFYLKMANNRAYDYYRWS